MGVHQAASHRRTEQGPGAEAGGLRAIILRHVRACPGTHKSAVCRAVGCGWGTVGHHIAILEQAGLLEVHRLGGRTLLYPTAMDAVERERFAAFRRGPSRPILDRLRRGPGRLCEIADAIERSQRTTRRHVRTLRETGLVEQVGPRQYGLSRHGAALLRRGGA